MTRAGAAIFKVLIAVISTALLLSGCTSTSNKTLTSASYLNTSQALNNSAIVQREQAQGAPTQLAPVQQASIRNLDQSASQVNTASLQPAQNNRPATRSTKTDATLADAQLTNSTAQHDAKLHSAYVANQQPVVTEPVSTQNRATASRTQTSRNLASQTQTSQTLALRTINTEAMRSGVIYQKNDASSNNPDQLGNPVYAAPDQLAFVENKANPFENAPVVAASAYDGTSQDEISAQTRIRILNAQITHTSCKNGWATAPDRLDASRVKPGHPYYLEIRLRNTPLFPVGHTYIAYGRMSPQGQPLDEQLIMLSPLGGYSGAAIAAALPMPGVLKPVADDCRIKPHAAYRVTLDAKQYTQLLQRILKAQRKIPAYALFAYNCNHFVADIVASVGILPSKNKYLPALRYIYSLIEANEERDARNRQPT